MNRLSIASMSATECEMIEESIDIIKIVFTFAVFVNGFNRTIALLATSIWSLLSCKNGG